MKLIKRIASIFLVVFMVAACSMTAFAAEGFDQDAVPRVVDGAKLLTDSERVELTKTLDEISKKHNVDVALVTFQKMPDGYKSMETLADDVYEAAKYGYGMNHDGLVLVINMDPSKWQISTEGYGIKAFTDAGIQYIGSQITPLLKNKKYADAFKKYASLADDFITKAKSGKAYDSKSLPKGNFDYIKAFGIASGIGVVVAGLIVGALSKQLKSVKAQETANFYKKEGSMKVTAQSDVYLFTNVTKTVKETPKTGSSTHFSSSGRSHGGGGGSF